MTDNPNIDTEEGKAHYRKLFDTMFELCETYDRGEILIAMAHYEDLLADDAEVCEGHSIIATHAAREFRHLAESLAQLAEDMFGTQPPDEEDPLNKLHDEAQKQVLARAAELERQAEDHS